MHQKVFFSINDYDRDGDCIDKGVFIHIEDVRIKASDTINEFVDFVKQFEDIIKEIFEHHENFR